MGLPGLEPMAAAAHSDRWTPERRVDAHGERRLVHTAPIWVLLGFGGVVPDRLQDFRGLVVQLRPFEQVGAAFERSPQRLLLSPLPDLLVVPGHQHLRYAPSA